MIHAWLLFAEEAAKPEQPWWYWLPFYGGILALAYLMLFRPMRRQEQERQSTLKLLKKNDRVLTSAGIYGTIISVSETEDEAVLKVDDNARIHVLKTSITRNLSGEEELRKAREQAAEQKK